MPVLSLTPTTVTPAQGSVSSFSTLSYALPATAFDDSEPAGSRSAAGEVASWNRVGTPVDQPVLADPQRSVFDAWDAEESEWEDTLATIAEADGGTDREAAIDALLGSLVG